MGNTLSKSSIRKITIALVVFGTVVATILVLVTSGRNRSAPSSRLRRAIPNPFSSEASSDLRGTLVQTGTQGTRGIYDVTFTDAETAQALPDSGLFSVVIANSPTISNNVPLNKALTANKKIYGYLYSDMDATREIDAAIAAEAAIANGDDVAFTDLFPHKFFASPAMISEKKAFLDSYRNKGVVFETLDNVMLLRNARYVMVTMDPGVTLTVRGIAICGNGRIEGTEACDDSAVCVNTSSGERVIENESPVYCDLTASTCPTGSACRLMNGDGCSDTCALEQDWACLDCGAEGNLCRGGSPVSPTNPQSMCNYCMSTDPTNDPNVWGYISWKYSDSVAAHGKDIDACFMNSVQQFKCDEMKLPTLISDSLPECADGCSDGVCVQTVTTPVCGNRMVEKKADGSVEETCDRGAENGVVCTPAQGGFCDYCTSDCKFRTVSWPSCGDGIVQTNEECDDANHSGDDGCNECTLMDGFACTNAPGQPSVCHTVPVCGNSTVETGEGCDPGGSCIIGGAASTTINCSTVLGARDCSWSHGRCSVVATETCSATCQPISLCGNGRPDAGEVCDNGTAINGDCTAPYGGTCNYCATDCLSTVTKQGGFCGDHVVQTPPEQCDPVTPDSTCRSDCKKVPTPF